MSSEFINRQIIELIQRIKEKITDESDTIWTSFETPKELRDHIEHHIQQLRKGDTKSLKEFNVLFMPTGSFQEHAMANNWSEEYMIWSEKFDNLLRKA